MSQSVLTARRLEWPTRAALIAFVAAGGLAGVASGTILHASGLEYRVNSGSTMIPDLPGLRPNADANVLHWGADASGATDSTAQVQTVLLELSGAGSGAENVLGSITLTAGTWDVEFHVTGALTGGVGRFKAHAMSTAGAVFNNGATPLLSAPGNGGTGAAAQRFRLYLTQTIGSSSVVIHTMRSAVSL